MGYKHRKASLFMFSGMEALPSGYTASCSALMAPVFTGLFCEPESTGCYCRIEGRNRSGNCSSQIFTVYFGIRGSEMSESLCSSHVNMQIGKLEYAIYIDYRQKKHQGFNGQLMPQ